MKNVENGSFWDRKGGGYKKIALILIQVKIKSMRYLYLNSTTASRQTKALPLWTTTV